MDFVQFLEKFGISLTVACAFAYYIWHQNKFLQEQLMQELDESFTRLEQIIVKLIDQQKVTQLDIKRITGYMECIEDIMAKLTGKRLNSREDKD